MRWLRDIRFRLAALVRRAEMKRDLDDEIEFHLEMEARKYEHEGMDPVDARRLARVRFGGEERFREQARDSWGVAPLIDFMSDVRYAARQLLQRPAFAVVSILTLALGIGGTVALFSVVDGLILRPLPFEGEEQLVTFWSDYDWRGAEFDFVRERVQLFDRVATYSDGAGTFHSESGSRLLLHSIVSAELFDVLGTAPMLGRTFREGEDRPGAEPAIVLSHGMWERDFGSDREVLGRRVDLDGTLRTVVGVMPEGFFYPSPESEAWIPLDLDPAQRDYGSNGWLVIVGRLRDGATPMQIEAELGRLTAALGENWTYPEQWDRTRDPYLTPMREYLVGDVRPVLLLLLAAVGLVLLMSCANVAALLVTRTADRAGDMAVRAALGAARLRLARQILTESVLLGVVGGIAGVVLAVAAFDLLVASLPLPRALDQTLGMDWTALAAGFALAIVAGGAVSLGPMHRLLRGDFEAGSFGSRSAGGTTSRDRNGLQRLLVTSQVLMAVVLATGASLLIRTVDELQAIDWGLDPQGVLTADVMLSETGDPAVRPLFYDNLLDRVSALPGVESVGMINRIPVRDGGWQGPVNLADRPELTGQQRPGAYYRPVSPTTFETLGIEVVEGRGFTPADTRDAPAVAIVNQAFARAHFGGESAVGRFFDRTSFVSRPLEIVGVIRDVAVDDLIGAVPPAVYYPWDQTLAESAYGILTVRSSLDLESLTQPIRDIVRELDPRATLGRVETMQSVVDNAMSEPLRLRFFLGLFSLLGIVLGTVGVYGVASFAVQRRQAEFGIRLALGATPRRLMGDVVQSGMLPVVRGVIVGSAVAFLGSTLLAGFLFGVEPTDPLSLGAAAVALLVTGCGASFLPAWRASATDPAVSLRSE